MIPFLPFSWLKKMKRAQCISHILFWSWLRGDEKFCQKIRDITKLVTEFTIYKTKKKQSTKHEEENL